MEAALRSLLLLSGALWGASAAPADTWYADGDSQTDGIGSDLDPFNSLESLIRHVTSGDTIYLCGTFEVTGDTYSVTVTV